MTMGALLAHVIDNKQVHKKYRSKFALVQYASHGCDANAKHSHRLTKNAHTHTDKHATLLRALGNWKLSKANTSVDDDEATRTVRRVGNSVYILYNIDLATRHACLLCILYNKYSILIQVRRTTGLVALSCVACV